MEPSVYIVRGHWDNEPGTILGVFHDEGKARIFFGEVDKGFDVVTLEQWEDFGRGAGLVQAKPRESRYPIR